MFAPKIAGTLANLRSKNATVGSVGRPYIHDNNPNANMFFARAASLRESPNSATAAMVMPVRSTGCTANPASTSSTSPSLSSGLES
ncbi:hypothetical protein GCM10009788_21830 [Nocardioides humi]|uniref:Uncharacterized protein n=1 Tax=Nocardioides humi TaxID=449461 RepID=A0ABN2AEL9_9ACTN